MNHLRDSLFALKAVLKSIGNTLGVSLCVEIIYFLSQFIKKFTLSRGFDFNFLFNLISFNVSIINSIFFEGLAYPSTRFFVCSIIFLSIIGLSDLILPPTYYINIKSELITFSLRFNRRLSINPLIKPILMLSNR